MQRVFSRSHIVAFVALLAVVVAGSAYGEPFQPDPITREYTNFVPMTTNIRALPTVFGVEVLDVRPERGLDMLRSLGPAWIRRNGLLWKDVETIEGRGYVWTRPNVVALEREMLEVRERGLELILVVRGSPRWATQPYTADCGPINSEKYGRYASFLGAAIKRYSQPPFNVRYWELGNEPDAPVGADSVYGCWGIPSDPYYGGRAYGEMLKAVYPAMKAANPSIQVLNGSLLLDKPNTPSSRFMDGVLLAGAANSFDVLGFHSYCMYDPTDSNGHDAMFDSCADDWKISFLRQLIRSYGVPSKPMLRTEAALLCSVPHTACRQQQADFIPRHFARTMRDQILGSIWFEFESDAFRNSALVEPSDPRVARPAFVAMTQASTMFGGARYLGSLSDQPAGVEGYRFERGREEILVVWSDETRTISIPVDQGAGVDCSNRDGRAIDCDNLAGEVSLTVGPSPAYVAWR